MKCEVKAFNHSFKFLLFFIFKIFRRNYITSTALARTNSLGGLLHVVRAIPNQTLRESAEKTN